ncbi:hypothetical protein LJK88_47005 [Paenibacillus sp. P26]|nr:hypothetical protein LJK88_47005 [Paenibacillus sp. P26]
MYKKTTILISAVLAFGLLTACGKKAPADETHATGHGAGHNQAGAGASGAGQGGNMYMESKGHGDHQGGHGSSAQTAASHLKASFTFASGSAKAGEPQELTIQITDKDGKPVNDFQVNHEKLLHLIIVSHDLSFFNHIHPEYKGSGKFTVNTSFPAGGDYKLFADFIPAGGSGTTLSEWVKVEGKEGARAAIQADTKLVKEVSGKEIELALSSTKAKEDVTLTFNLRDAKTKKEIDNLEPYLGAVGHVVILSADAEQYIHVHPLDEKATGPATAVRHLFSGKRDL